MTPTAPQPASAPPLLWAENFSAFGLFHVIVVVACVGITVLACVLATRSSHRRERTVRLTWVWITIVTQVFAIVWYMLPSNFDPQVSLPLHMCDLAVWLVPLALLTESHRARALLYFWGIGLSSQAFMTPVLSEGYNHLHFWLFWGAHTQIVGGAVFDLWARGFRPGWAHYRFAVLAGVVYGVSMVGFNEIYNSNYGYLGRTLPDKKTLLNSLPPWPWRVLVLSLLALFVQLLALLPWLFVGRPPQAPSASPSGSNTIEP